MKILTVVTLGFALLSASSMLKAEREILDLTTDWKFSKQDADPKVSPATWETVSIPHTWNALDGQLGNKADPESKHGYHRGPAWYALSLNAPDTWKGKRVFVLFEAASLVSQTYLNGKPLGEHRGGFTAFCYELTPYLQFGGINDLRVRVDNSEQEDVVPLEGDFNIDGGLYRPVHLIVTDALCISPLDFASPGVYLSQNSISKASATIEARSLVSNGSSAPANLRVETEIKDASGKSVARMDSDAVVAAGKTEPVLQNLTFSNPHLWQARKDPYLYTVAVRILRDGKTVDEVTQPLGVRTVQINEEKGFLLNGEAYPIHGVNRHQDWQDKGWALGPSDHDEDARIILDIGATAVRLTHYPQSEYFHSLCDRNGLLLWNEVSLVNRLNDTPAFAANAEQQLREMILQRYNHPACVFWGIFNELKDDLPSSAALLNRLKAVIHELDPARIDVAASNKAHSSLNKIPSSICFNTYPGWYGKGKPEEIAEVIKGFSKDAGRRIALSEYGAGASPLQHVEGMPQNVDSKGQFHPEEWQTAIHESEWRIIQNNPNLWGSFVWVMFDFPSARRHEGGRHGLNDKGLVTQDRKIKKDAYYLYKANWNPQPMVYIAARRSTSRKIADTSVETFSNCDEVELVVNGHSIGKVKPDNAKVSRWENITLQAGKNRVEAVGFSKGQRISDACEWVLEAP